MRRFLFLLAGFAVSAAAQQTEVGVRDPVYRPGDGVTSPEAVYKPDPQYSEEARQAKLQGTVYLSVLVDQQGRPVNARVVVGPLGLGLDEAAIYAVVAQWRFRPGMKDGRAVAVRAQYAVNFRLPEK